jgi:hypothetical protein
MTSTIAVKLQPQITGKIIRLVVGLASGLFLTAFMFWSMQTLIQVSAPEMLFVSTKARLNNSNIQGYSIFSEQPLAGAKLRDTQDQPVVPRYAVPFESNLPNGSIETEHPQSSPAISVSAGFSLGVGEGDYLPVIKVTPVNGRYKKSRTKLRRNDGFCTIQNPVTRVGAVKDSTILKGRCSTRFNG